MKKSYLLRILLLLTQLFIFLIGMSQTLKLIPFRKGTKWGYANEKRILIVPAKYDSVSIFSNGLGSFKVGQLWGVLDGNGKEFIPAKYTYISNFYGNCAIVRKKVVTASSYGIINRAGVEIIPDEYDQFYMLSHGLIKAKKGSQFGLFDSTGKELLRALYQSIGNFSEGFATIQYADKYGFVDSTGKVFLMPEKYTGANAFSNGFASVSVGEKFRRLDHSYVNKNGIALGRYGSAGNFSDGVAVIRPIGREDYQVALIDTNQRIIFRGTKHMTQIENFKNGVGIYTVVMNGDSLTESEYYLSLSARVEKRGLINRYGKIIIPPAYDRIYTTSCSKYLVLNKDKYGVLDINGKELLPTKYDKIIFGGDTSVCLVKENSKWGVFSANGKELLKKRYDSIGNFNENLAVIVSNNKYGYIDKTGKEVVPPRFEYALSFGLDEVAFVIQNNLWGLIDKKGKVIREPKYDVRTYKESYTDRMIPIPYFFTDGISRVIYKGMAGYIDKTGKEYWENNF
ncbi:MAG: WG repeat-containing protein [Chitinophagaceae bacterium]|nr:WG repeat-containing protein [Chitinophagaceae bacterium]